MKKILFLAILINFIFAFEMKNDARILHKTLENGLEYYILENKLPKNSAEIYIYVGSGSVNETDKEQGIAHFVEHMTFNGTRDFEKNELIKMLESFGVKFGADLNAATSFESTIYRLSINVSDENLKNAFKVFENMAFLASFDESEIASEKGVVTEEDRLRLGADERYFKEYVKYIYKDSIYAKRLPIGKMEIIQGADQALVRGFYERNYQPQNMSIIAVGDFNATFVENLIVEGFSNYKNSAPIPAVDKQIPRDEKLEIFNIHDKEIGEENVAVYYFEPFLAQNSYENIKESRKLTFAKDLFKILVQRAKDSNLIDDNIQIYSYNFENQNMITIFSVNANEKDYDKPLKSLFSLINFVRENGFEKSDFEALKKDYFEANENALKQSTNRKNIDYIRLLLGFIESEALVLSPQDAHEITLKALNEITLDEINAKFRALTEKNPKFIEFQTLDEFKFDSQKIAAHITQKPLNLASARELPKSIFEGNLTAVKPKISENEKLGTKIFTYPNGATLVFKQISTEKESVNFAAVERGGIFDMNNTDEIQAAVTVANLSGIGEFNKYEVGKITAGEMFELKKFINQYAHGYSGFSTTKDLESLFKTLYVDMNAPKMSISEFKTYQKNAIDAIEKMSSQPDFRFKRDFNKFFYKNNPKMNVAEKENYLNLDTQIMENFLRENFGNAANYAFFVVGDANESQIRAFSDKYIANLPSKKKAEIEISLPEAISGENVFLRDFESENRADSVINIFSNTKYSQEKDAKLQATVSVLNTLMREKIREEDGQVYGIRAYSNFANVLNSRIMLNIYFSCEPKNLANIVRNVKEIIANLSANLSDEKYLNDFKTATFITLEKNYELPKFWLDGLRNVYIYGDEFLTLDEQKALLNSVTLQDVQEIAKNEFSSPNFTVSSNIFKDANLTEIEANLKK